MKARRRQGGVVVPCAVRRELREFGSQKDVKNLYPPPVPLFLRATFAVLVLPGMMGFALPLLVIIPAWPTDHRNWWALAVVGLGTWLLFACVREFYVAGKGTLAPWSPPKHLVTSGPFAYSRNPIYVAMLIIIAGWTLFFWSRALAIYLALMFAAFHIRTLLGEEPRLAREFGAAWTAYRARVRRWL